MKCLQYHDRYNDGAAMLAFWKLDIAQNNNHYKYLFMAHHFIAA